MGDFFHGWRRKIGVVMLVLALSFMVGMVRTAKFDDRMQTQIGDTNYCLLSSDGLVRFTRYTAKDAPPLVMWESRSSNSGTLHDVVGGAPIAWKWHVTWFGFEAGFGNFRWGTVPIAAFSLPYWIAIPLTLLTAWLLLSKPRSRHPINVVETVTAAGI